MALPASPPITLQQVEAEFSAPAGTPLASFLRGGAYVPNAAPNLSVPTALPISLLDLLGAAAAPAVAASISTRVVNANRAVPPSSTATALYAIYATGDVRQQLNGGTLTTPETWLDVGANTDFQVRATYVSGSVPSGTLGTWLDTTSNYSWSASTTGAGAIVEDTVMTVEIRNKVTLAVLTTATITLRRTLSI